MTKRLVILDRFGLVHDLATDTDCSSMMSLRRELIEGRARYSSVKGIQALVYKLPGCRKCFGSEPEYHAYISTAT